LLHARQARASPRRAKRCATRSNRPARRSAAPCARAHARSARCAGRRCSNWIPAHKHHGCYHAVAPRATTRDALKGLRGRGAPPRRRMPRCQSVRSRDAAQRASARAASAPRGRRAARSPSAARRFAAASAAPHAWRAPVMRRRSTPCSARASRGLSPAQVFSPCCNGSCARSNLAPEAPESGDTGAPSARGGVRVPRPRRQEHGRPQPPQPPLPRLAPPHDQRRRGRLRRRRVKTNGSNAS
jgi:hypothetical protein